MNTRDFLWLGFKSLRERKVRALLTIFSVLIGVASIIALVSQTTGIQTSIVKTLETLGPTSIILTGRGTPLTQADVAKAISVPYVEEAIPVLSERATLYRSGQPTSLTLMGVDSEGLVALLGEAKLIEGSVYPATTSPLAVVGYNVAFPVSQGEAQAIQLGQPVVLEHQVGQTTQRTTLQVMGLLDKYGSSPLISIDDSIFIPIDAAMRISNRRSYSFILIRVVDSDRVEDVSTLLTNIYGNSAQIMTIQQISGAVSTITGLLGLLLGTIASISLTVAGLGIMNIMLVSVLERTHEIGLLKSIGFKDTDVLTLFIAEALIIGAIGGIAGLLAGAVLSNAIPLLIGSLTGSARAGSSSGGIPNLGVAAASSVSMSYTPVITLEIAIMSLAIAVFVSVGAGLYPAWRASRMDPIKALRYE